MKTLRTGRLVSGVCDGPADTACPEGAVLKSEGFDYRRGYARAELTTTPTGNADIAAGYDVRGIVRLVEENGTAYFYALCNGYLWRDTDNVFQDPTIASVLSIGATTATRSTLVVTLAAGAKALKSVQAGDIFIYPADATAGGVVASVDSDTQLTLVSAPGGMATSGTFELRRKHANGGHLIVAGGKVWVFDGTNVPHWYKYGGLYRPAGLPAPTVQPTITLAATGGLATGNYYWAWAYRDADGRTGNPIYSQQMVAAASDAATISGFANGPEWATQIDIWRTKANGTQFFSVYKDVSQAQFTTLVYGAPNTTCTLIADHALLVANMHVDRYLKFTASGNSYLIVSNTTTAIVVAGNASAEGINASITGGFDVDALVAGSFIDVVPDASLDVDYPDPDENDQPPAGLTAPAVSHGGGRLLARSTTNNTRLYASGRNTYAQLPTGAATGGLGEFDYWPNYIDVGTADGDFVVSPVVLGERIFCAKQHSTWEIYSKPIDVGNWDAFPAPLAQAIGMASPYSLAIKEGVAYWFGVDGEEADIIRFDGDVGYGMLRQYDSRLRSPRGRVIPGNMTAANTRAAGVIFKGCYFLAYRDTAVAGTVNNRVLRYDLKTNAVSVLPEAVGLFAQPYSESGTATLLCSSAATTDCLIFTFLTNAGTSVVRELIPKAFSFGPGTLTSWTFVRVGVINDEALNAARLPAMYFSVDGKAFNDATKTWTLLSADEAWPSALGEWTARAEIPTGNQTQVLHLKVTDTDHEAWGITEIEVDGDPTFRDMNMETQ